MFATADDKFELIRLLLKHRFRIAICTRIAQAQSESERQSLLEGFQVNEHTATVVSQIETAVRCPAITSLHRGRLACAHTRDTRPSFVLAAAASEDRRDIHRNQATRGTCEEGDGGARKASVRVSASRTPCDGCKLIDARSRSDASQRR